MTASHRWMRIRCPDCSATALCGPEQMLVRLRELGMLRREKEPSRDLIGELFVSAAGRMSCSQCNRRGLEVSEAEDDWDDSAWQTARPCSDCGKPIPSERLTVFPDAQRCLPCQQAAERGDDPATPEYCPRCGTPMVMRARRGAGLAGYEMICPECRR